MLTLLLVGGLQVVPREPSFVLGVGSNLHWAGTSSDAERDLATVSQLGLPHIREDVLWQRVQPSGPDDWRWAPYDRLFSRASRAGVEVLPILGYGTPWVTGSELRSLPDADSERAAFSRYAQTFIRRYGTAGYFWRQHPHLPALPVRAVEIWNEPWYPGPSSASAYVKLVAAAGGAMRQVQPDVMVLACADRRVRQLADGRVADWGSAVLQEVARTGVQVDAWSIHPYAKDDGLGATSPVQDSMNQVRRLQTDLGALRLPGQVWVTEIGFPDDGEGQDSVKEETSSRHLQAVAHGFRQLAVGPNPVRRVYAFTLARPTPDSARPGAWDYGFNLLRQDGSIKPALEAFSRID